MASLYINYAILDPLYHISITHTTCTISDFSLFSSRLFRFVSLRRRFSSFTLFLSSTKARERSLTCFSSSLKASFFSFDLLIPGVLIIDENLIWRKEKYNTIIKLEKDQFHNMSSSNYIWKLETIVCTVLYKDSFHAFLACVASPVLG